MTLAERGRNKTPEKIDSDKMIFDVLLLDVKSRLQSFVGVTTEAEDSAFLSFENDRWGEIKKTTKMTTKHGGTLYSEKKKGGKGWRY